MSAAAEDRPDDPRRAPALARDFAVRTPNGQRRTVMMTPESIRANRLEVRRIFGCPDADVDDCVAYSLKHIDE